MNLDQSHTGSLPGFGYVSDRLVVTSTLYTTIAYEFSIPFHSVMDAHLIEYRGFFEHPRKLLEMLRHNPRHSEPRGFTRMQIRSRKRHQKNSVTPDRG
jgi:hypothetical protein